MELKEILNRANLYALETHILYGSEAVVLPPEKTYAEKLKRAERDANIFFKNHFTSTSEYDEISGLFYEQIEVFKEVYFEIGLILGAKIALQIGERMKELD